MASSWFSSNLITFPVFGDFKRILESPQSLNPKSEQLATPYPEDHFRELAQISIGKEVFIRLKD